MFCFCGRWCLNCPSNQKVSHILTSLLLRYGFCSLWFSPDRWSCVMGMIGSHDRTQAHYHDLLILLGLTRSLYIQSNDFSSLQRKTIDTSAFNWKMIVHLRRSPVSRAMIHCFLTITTQDQHEGILISQQNGGFAWLIPASII